MSQVGNEWGSSEMEKNWEGQTGRMDLINQANHKRQFLVIQQSRLGGCKEELTL